MINLFPNDMSSDPLSEILAAMARLPDDIRKQAKFDYIVALMQGEGGNFSAGIYISVLAAFTVAMAGQGFDPQGVMLNIGKATRDEIKKLLKEEGISTSKPLDS